MYTMKKDMMTTPNLPLNLTKIVINDLQDNMVRMHRNDKLSHHTLSDTNKLAYFPTIDLLTRIHTCIQDILGSQSD